MDIDDVKSFLEDEVKYESVRDVEGVLNNAFEEIDEIKQRVDDIASNAKSDIAEQTTQTLEEFVNDVIGDRVSVQSTVEEAPQPAVNFIMDDNGVEYGFFADFESEPSFSRKIKNGDTPNSSILLWKDGSYLDDVSGGKIDKVLRDAKDLLRRNF